MAPRSTQSAYDIEMLRTECDEARSELSALRQRVAEFERERDAARSGHDYAVAEQAKSTAYFTELIQERLQSAFDLQEYKLNIRLMREHNTKQHERIAELEAAQSNQADSLQAWADLWAHIATRFGEYDALPNSANFDAMLSAQAIVTPNNCRHCRRAAEKMREAAANVAEQCKTAPSPHGNDRRHVVAVGIANTIRAIPLPACEGCNPLKPE